MRMESRIAAQSWLEQRRLYAIMQALPASFVNPERESVITTRTAALDNHRLLA